MKTLYVRLTADNKFGYDIISSPMYKEYPEFGVAITKTKFYNDFYRITDIKTGTYCGRSFKQLKDAKAFMEHTEESNFKDWYKEVEKARQSERYQRLIIRIR